MQFRSITPSTATRFVSSATVFVELTSLETTIMAVFCVGFVISVQERSLFMSTEKKMYIPTYEWSKLIYCGTYFEFCYKSLKNI